MGKLIVIISIIFVIWTIIFTIFVAAASKKNNKLSILIGTVALLVGIIVLAIFITYAFTHPISI